MVLGIRGPRALVASYLASALSSVLLDVDPDSIELCLDRDEKVVLQNISIRPKTWKLQRPLYGKARSLSFFGSIEKLTLFWKFSTTNDDDDSHQPSWIRDVSLTAQGLKLTLKVSLGDEAPQTPQLLSAANNTKAASTEPNATSGWKAYLARELNQMLEHLKLDIQDFEFVVDLPPPQNVGGRMQFLVGSESLQLVSIGRGANTTTENSTGASTTEKEKETRENGETSVEKVIQGPLRQEFRTKALYGVLVEDSRSASDGCSQHFVIEPFDYKASVTRTSGTRLLGLGTGLEFSGTPNDDGVVLHGKTMQIKAITHLIRCFNPPKPKEETYVKASERLLRRLSHIASSRRSSTGIPSIIMEEESNDENETVSKKVPCLMLLVAIIAAWYWRKIALFLICLGSAVAFALSRLLDDLPHDSRTLVRDGKPKRSVFRIPLAPVTIVLGGGERVSMPMATVTYNLEGHVVDLDMPSLELMNSDDDKQGASASVSGVTGRIVPGTVFHMALVEDIHIPGLLRLSMPLKDVTARFVQGNLHVTTQSSVELKLLPKATATEKEPKSITSSSELKLLAKKMTERNLVSRRQRGENQKSGKKGVLIPFSVYVTVPYLDLRKSCEDKVFYEFHELDLAVKPDHETNGLDVELSADDVKNKMLHLSNVNMSLWVDPMHADVIRNMHFATDLVRLQSGYSSVDWSKLNGFFVDSQVIKVPYAHVSKLRLRLSLLEEKNGITAAETGMEIDSFTGDAGTTSSDLTRYYSQVILSQAPSLITNSEVLGRTVSDTVLTTATPILLSATPAGVAGGIAAVVAYDGVKNVVTKAKTSRNVGPDAPYRPGDFGRGMLVTIAENVKENENRLASTEHMQAFAEKKVQGAVEYVDKNQTRLGAATVAGAVTVGVSIVGTPAAGIPAGIVAGALTAKGLRKLEERREKKQD